jgi:hypothetical protein
MTRKVLIDRASKRASQGIVLGAGLESVQDASRTLRAPLDERRQWHEVYTLARRHRCLPRAHGLARAAQT